MLGPTVATAEATFTSNAATSHSWAAGAFYNQMVIASGPVPYWRLGNTGTTTSDTMGTAALVRNRVVGRPLVPHEAVGRRLDPGASLPTVPRARMVFKGDATHLNYLMAWDATGYRMRFVVDWPRTPPDHRGSRVCDGLLLALRRGHLRRLQRSPLPRRLPGRHHAASGTLHTSTLPLALSRNDGIGMTGDPDEVAVWSRDLTATEVRAFYDAGPEQFLTGCHGRPRYTG